MTQEILELKYLNGKTKEQKFKDVAKVLHKDWMDFSEESIYDALYNNFIVLGGSVLANVDTPSPVSLSNCFVIKPPDDSYEDILRTSAELVHLMKRRGGVGVDISNIRPKGLPVDNAAKTSTGIVPFMERYSNDTKEVAQDGRRGALMLTIDIRHPEAEDFIDAKTNTNKVTGANISIKLTDDFMQAAKEGKLFTQTFPIGSKNPILTKEVDAGALLLKIANNITKFAEPGILFWDTVLDNRIDRYAEDHNIPELKTVSTNPCGEVPLSPDDSCRLLHINYYNIVDRAFKPDAKVSFTTLNLVSRMAVQIGNSIIEEEQKKIKQILKKVEKSGKSSIEYKLWKRVLAMNNYRRLGIGRTGVADMLAALGLPYGPNHQLNKIILESYNAIEKESERLVEVFGALEGTNRVNIGLHTVAPVGTGSILAEVSSGIEPVFRHEVFRRRRANENDTEVETDSNGERWVKYRVVHAPFLKWATVKGIDLNVTPLDEAVKLSPYWGSMADQVDPENKLEVQKAFQVATDHSISITHNFKAGTESKVIYKSIIKAHSLKLKGYTAYVDGSRTNILSATDDSNSGRVTESAEVHMLKVKDEIFYGIVGLSSKGNPVEIFLFKDKNIKIKDLQNANIIKEENVEGNKYHLISDNIDIIDLASRYNSDYQSLYTKLISRALRAGVAIPKIMKDFESTDTKLGSFRNAIYNLLSYYTQLKCANCGSIKIAFQEGCLMCQDCGYSKCG